MCRKHSGLEIQDLGLQFRVAKVLRNKFVLESHHVTCVLILHTEQELIIKRKANSFVVNASRFFLGDYSVVGLRQSNLYGEDGSLSPEMRRRQLDF